MIKTLFTILFACLCIAGSAQSKDERAVAAAVENLRKAMIDADSAMLWQLSSPQLSYGHSSGHIDDRLQFVQKISSGKSDFVSMNLTDQTITVSGKTAIVRHKLDAVTNDNGKSGEVHLLVLLVWHKQGRNWVLLARQAVKNQ